MKCRISAVVASFFVAAAWATGEQPRSDHHDRGLQFLEARVKSDPDDFLAHNQIGDRSLTWLRETGHEKWLVRASRAAADSLKAVPPEVNAGGVALQARVDLALHRFRAAKDAAIRLRQAMPEKATPLQILWDALFELGELEEAEKVLRELSEIEGASVPVESRRAKLAKARGDHRKARQHLMNAAEAARNLFPLVPLTVAWCELQIGELAFSTGDWEAAENSYAKALELVPGWWSAREHLAELRAAQGKDAEALKIYTELVATVPRPELFQAIGDLHLYKGRKDDARPWLEKAREEYLVQTVKESDAWYHHLAGFFSDSLPDPAEAVKWARKDLEIRDTAHARAALAWALYKAGDVAAAAEETKKALASGLRDAHVLYQAALIRIGAGDVEAGQTLMREAAVVNPRFNAFHVHR